MVVADSTAHRALLYLSAIQRQGYLMTVDEFRAYVARPSRDPGRAAVRRTEYAGTTAVAQILRQHQEWSRRLVESLGPREVTVDQGTPGEGVVEWLTRLKWITEIDGRLRITQLGEAVVSHLEAAEQHDSGPVSIKLDRGDDFALARVIGQIADVGESLLVDPYFSFENLVHLFEATQVRGVLTGTQDKKKLASLQVALAGLPLERDFEIRKSDVFHDRFVVPLAGPVWMLGTSLNGIGNRFSVMVQIDDPVLASSIRSEVEKAWEAAETVRKAERNPDPPTESGGKGS